MQALESMKQRMAALKLYDLTKDGCLTAALTAYAVVLDEAARVLTETEREMYLVSAQSWGLQGKCSALRVADGSTLQRSAGLALLGVRRGRATRADFEELVQQLGLSGPLYECPAQQSVMLCCAAVPQELDFIKHFLRRLFPAQLEVRLDLRGTAAQWSALDVRGLTWGALDARGESWADRESGIVTADV